MECDDRYEVRTSLFEKENSSVNTVACSVTLPLTARLEVTLL